jgi:hypothetical protein
MGRHNEAHFVTDGNPVLRIDPVGAIGGEAPSAKCIANPDTIISTAV